jgi:hypothetical protein
MLLVQFAPRIAEAEAATTYDERIGIINGVSAHIAGKLDEHLASLPDTEGLRERVKVLEGALRQIADYPREKLVLLGPGFYAMTLQNHARAALTEPTDEQ